MGSAQADTDTKDELTSKPLCGAKRTGGGGTCKMPAGYGTDHPGYGHCKHHFGATPPGKHRAALEAAEEVREQMVPVFGTRGEDLNWLTPELAVLLELRRTWRIIAWYDSQIEMLNGPGDVVLRSLEDGFKIAAWTKAHRDERQHLVRTSKVAIDAGVQERMLHLMEVQAVELATGIRRILDGLGLSPEQAKRAPDLVRSVLSQLAIETQASEVEP